MPCDVLIVDDSTAIRKILQRFLRQADLPLGEVYEAGDGVEALEFLKQHKVGLILADIMMPNMDGLEFLRALRLQQAFKTVPVLMITSDGDQNRVMEAVKLGANGLMRKPFTADQIKQKLAGMI